jgi:hypothetical protein
MKTHRFGQKIKLHSTRAIKHQTLTLMLEDEIRTLHGNSVFQPNRLSGDRSAKKAAGPKSPIQNELAGLQRSGRPLHQNNQ